jgi:hypothetical protein
MFGCYGNVGRLNRITGWRFHYCAKGLNGLIGGNPVCAYYLEDKIALYPRFVVDTNCMKEFGEVGSLCKTEHGVCFIDPFRLDFCEHLRGARYESAEALAKAGLPEPQSAYRNLSNETILALICHSLHEQLKTPMDDRAFAKVEWLYDRIGKQIKLGPAKQLRTKKSTSR